MDLFDCPADELYELSGMPAGARVRYQPSALSSTRADALLERLRARNDWRHEQFRHVRARRSTAWVAEVGVDYRYSGQLQVGRGWDPLLEELRSELVEQLGCALNSLLLNRYPDGRAAMGWHADDEPELGPEPVIASVSLGATRDFQFKPKAGGEIRTHALQHGSLLVMDARTQELCLHRLPPRVRLSGERINLTFRDMRA